MITLLGVGHVFDLRSRIQQEIYRRGPRAVCLELDPGRFEALRRKERSGDMPLMVRLAAFVQQRMARSYGGDVGDEMLAAADAAKAVGAAVFLVDMDAGAVLQRLTTAMTFEEKVKLVVSALAGLFVRRERVEKELQAYEEDRAGYIEALGEQLPTVRRVLIDERNAHMANALRQVHASHDPLVAVVGDGHVDGLATLLADLPVETVRLGALRTADDASNVEAGFSLRLP